MEPNWDAIAEPVDEPRCYTCGRRYRRLEKVELAGAVVVMCHDCYDPDYEPPNFEDEP